MRSTRNNYVLGLFVIVALISLSIFALINYNKNDIPVATAPLEASEYVPLLPYTKNPKVIGKSKEGRALEAYTYGAGPVHLLFVGGMHGGYEWNSTLLSYSIINYLTDKIIAIPKNITVVIIPSANPDGLYRVISKEGRFTLEDIPSSVQPFGTGRFNAAGVDLNRNFDCKWKPQSMWQKKIVSAGSEPFSEPESRAIRDFILNYKPQAVIFWHSKANAVYASQCTSGILPTTLDIMNAYAKASGYKAVESFDSYEVTGDAEGWLASINIPAITVELQSHTSPELHRNLSGVNSLLEYFSTK